MNFINKGIMSGRAKLSRIIHVKPYHLSDEKNKENIDISNPTPGSPPPPPDSSTKLTSSLTNSVEDLFEEDPLPPPPKSNSITRRSRSLDRLPVSGASLSDRRDPYFDIRNHTHSHSLGSPELAPVFTTTYRTVFSTITANNNPTMNGTNINYSNVNKNSLSSKFKTTEFAFQKSPVKRRAKW